MRRPFVRQLQHSHDIDNKMKVRNEIEKAASCQTEQKKRDYGKIYVALALTRTDVRKNIR